MQHLPGSKMATHIFLLSFFLLLAGISGNEIETDGQCRLVNGKYILDEPCIRHLSQDTKMIQFLMSKSKSTPVQPTKEVLNLLLSVFSTNGNLSLLNGITCSACTITVRTYKSLPHLEFTTTAFLNSLKAMCVRMKLSREVCHGTVDMYAKTVMEILKSSKYPPHHICSLLLNRNCGEIPPEGQWEVAIPGNKPPVTKPSLRPNMNKRVKVLHIADTHWDTQYVEGSWSECNQPICCRKENIPPTENAARAGKFGGWRCDTPETTFDSMLQHINIKHPDVDYIIWTGDIPAHDLWEQTVPKNLDILKRTVAKIFAAFPKTPLYPAIGNHESVPPNLFPTSNDKGENPMDWLFSVVNEQWSKWLPLYTSGTIRQGAYYTTLARPGLRIVSMNTNYCYRMNWWLIKNDQDPVNELQWLVNVLQEAEKNNEKVHIVGHIPPGSTECLRQWQKNYYNIINRFEGTVTSQFFGHTHSDEFEVFYDMVNTSRPVGVAYIGPSLTTYMNHNPAYRIYYVEGENKNSSRYVLDHETWYLDLPESNQLNTPRWKLLYNAKSAYNMTSLFPQDWDSLFQRMKKSDDVLQLYHKYFWNDSPKRPASCDKTCRKQRLCGIKSCELYGPQ